MSKETTPIEDELSFVESYVVGDTDWMDKYKFVIANLIKIYNKAYREKYKHTKEDVLLAYRGGQDKYVNTNYEYKQMEMKAEQYYNETHNK